MAAPQAELVFIPYPGMGHLPPVIEIARKLVAQYPDQISITVLIMKFPSPDNMMDSFIRSLGHINGNDIGDGGVPRSGVSIIELPKLVSPLDLNHSHFPKLYMDAYKPIIRQYLLEMKHRYSVHSANQVNQPGGQKHLAGLVLDMCCTSFINVANEVGAPSYIFFTSGAAFLHMMLHFGYSEVPDVTLGEQDCQPSQLRSDEINWPVIELPGFINPTPSKVWPQIFLEKNHGWHTATLEMGRRLRETKGIMINTFMELESNLIRSINEQNGPVIPTVYPVGPIINLNTYSFNNSDKKDLIMRWLDSQPLSSVVFLCFGSWGTFDENQVKEIATAVEQSGQRFLWSIRRKATTNSCDERGHHVIKSPEEYEDLKEVLPEGFLDRTTKIGRVIGWAPQASVLGHKAVGAFVSHCGWNSILECMWFGVPLVVWPMYSEQELNAFALVKELGLAIDVKMGYYSSVFQREKSDVEADVIEKGIRKVMEEEEGKRLRKKMKQVSEKARKCLEVGGSSYKNMDRFIEDVFKNLC